MSGFSEARTRHPVRYRAGLSVRVRSVYGNVAERIAARTGQFDCLTTFNILVLISHFTTNT